MFFLCTTWSGATPRNTRGTRYLLPHLCCFETVTVGTIYRGVREPRTNASAPVRRLKINLNPRFILSDSHLFLVLLFKPSSAVQGTPSEMCTCPVKFLEYLTRILGRGEFMLPGCIICSSHVLVNMAD